MIAITVIADAALQRELDDVLTPAGWTVMPARDAEDALRRCESYEADVLMIDASVPGGPIAFLDRVNGAASLLHTGVVVVGDSLDVDGVMRAMERGAADVLRTPVDPGDVIARAIAAARTKALVKQLTVHDDRIEEMVLFDDLTGLRNRRAVLLEMDTLVAGARRHKRDLAALMIDVDRFKSINDTLGHRAGDAVLRELAHRITGRLRDADVAGRLGGDEIVILLPETDATGAAVVADSIRSAVAAGPIGTPSGPIDVTVSLGIAAWEGEPAELLLERSDQALYQAKAAGRDRSAAI